MVTVQKGLRSIEIELEEGETPTLQTIIDAVRNRLDLDPDNESYTYYVNGVGVDLDTPIRDGSRISISVGEGELRKKA